MDTKKQRKKYLLWLRNIILLIIIINIFIFNKGNFINNNIQNAYLLNPLKVLKNKGARNNILIFGVDGVDNQKTKGKRADSIMILSLDSNGTNPSLISIPRDTRVEIKGRRSQEKINHAHAYGGTELLIDTIENFLDIPIDYYVKVNYKVVEELVDALGGIELDIPMDMHYSDPYDDPPLYIDIKKGLQTMNGKDTLHFLRFRSGYANQDLGRIEAQQQFASVIMKKVKSPMTMLKVPKLTRVFYNNVDTNISKTKMFYWGATNIIGSKELTRLTLPGLPATIKGVSYYTVKDEDIKNIRNDYLISTLPLNNNNKVEVLNGCGVQGAAAKIEEKLGESQIIVDSIGNYDKTNIEESFIKYNKENKRYAKKVSKILGIKKIIEMEENHEDINITIIVGKDLA